MGRVWTVGGRIARLRNSRVRNLPIRQAGQPSSDSWTPTLSSDGGGELHALKMALGDRGPVPTSLPAKHRPSVFTPCMSLRKHLEDWQVRWAERNEVRLGTP